MSCVHRVYVLSPSTIGVMYENDVHVWYTCAVYMYVSSNEWCRLCRVLWKLPSQATGVNVSSQIQFFSHPISLRPRCSVRPCIFVVSCPIVRFVWRPRHYSLLLFHHLRISWHALVHGVGNIQRRCNECLQRCTIYGWSIQWQSSLRLDLHHSSERLPFWFHSNWQSWISSAVVIRG